MKAFVFIILMIMPDQSYDLKSHLVPECPDESKISIIMNEIKDSGQILEWGGVCVKFELGDKT